MNDLVIHVDCRPRVYENLEKWHALTCAAVIINLIAIGIFSLFELSLFAKALLIPVTAFSLGAPAFNRGMCDGEFRKALRYEEKWEESETLFDIDEDSIAQVAEMGEDLLKKTNVLEGAFLSYNNLQEKIISELKEQLEQLGKVEDAEKKDEEAKALKIEKPLLATEEEKSREKKRSELLGELFQARRKIKKPKQKLWDIYKKKSEKFLTLREEFYKQPNWKILDKQLAVLEKMKMIFSSHMEALEKETQALHDGWKRLVLQAKKLGIKT